MASTIGPTSELEAVNEILSSIGEAPITSLSGSLPSDVTVIRQILDRTNREVQSQGWWFNREYSVTLSLNGSSQAEIADSIISLDSDPDGTDLVERKNGSTRMLYNRATNSYTLTAAPKVNLIRLLDFEAIPEAARRYITLKAARRFQNRFMGDREGAQDIYQDELEAKAELLQTDAENGDHNMLDTEPNTSIATFRRYADGE